MGPIKNLRSVDNAQGGVNLKKIIMTLGIVSLLLGAMCGGLIGLVPNAEGAGGDWIERIIADPSESVNSIAIGDADNNGNMDVVVGTAATSNELRIYTKVGDFWEEEIIDDFSVGVLAVAIGDADNDGFNEIIAGMEPGPAELYIYEKDDNSWQQNVIDNLGIDINSVAIGDVDNDGNNEVVTGEDTATNGVRIYEGSGSSWNNEHTIDPPAQVNSVAIGDADNDMNNELVIGMDSAAPDFEVRAYEYVVPDWVEDNITAAPTDVLSVAIGDGDNDGSNDVVFGMMETANEIRLYTKNGGWAEMFAPVPNVNADVNSIVIGDVDNDAKNEILAGLASTNGEVIAFEYDWFIADWTMEIIADTPTSVMAVGIGDADGESNNEAVIGMTSTTNEVRLYSLDRGELVFVSHSDGDYVSGNERFDVFVTSNYVESVKFYLNDVVIFQDTNDPYQFVVDTTVLVDDTTYTIKAEGLRFNAPSLIDTVDVIVKNSAIVGGYISVSTMEFEYNPDQDVAVVINTVSPPAYDYVNLVVGYTDPSGSEMMVVKDNLPVASQYTVILPLSSDSELGSYDVNAEAFGYDGDFLIWEASDTTTFNVSGKNLNDMLDDILNDLLDELNEVETALNNSITTLGEVMENEHEFSRSEILARINDTIDALDGFDQSVLDHDADMKVIMDDLEDLMNNENNLTRQELLSGLGIVVNEIEDLNSDVITKTSEIKTQLANETSEIDTNLANHDADLGVHDENLEDARKELKEATDTIATYQLVTLILLIISLVFLLISLMLVNKGYKMMKDAKSGGMKEKEPTRDEPIQKDMIEEDPEIEDAIDDAIDEIEQPSE